MNIEWESYYDDDTKTLEYFFAVSEQLYFKKTIKIDNRNEVLQTDLRLYNTEGNALYEVGFMTILLCAGPISDDEINDAILHTLKVLSKDLKEMASDIDSQLLRLGAL